MRTNRLFSVYGVEIQSMLKLTQVKIDKDEPECLHLPCMYSIFTERGNSWNRKKTSKILANFKNKLRAKDGARKKES